MPTAEHIAIAEAYAELYSTGDLSLIDRIYTADQSDELKAHIAEWHQMFPDFHVTVDDVVSEGDKLVIRVTARGSHIGELVSASMGKIPANGKPFHVSQIQIHRMVDGKIAESWEVWDQLGLFQQLGVLPQRGND
jgi:predicted ester cyclase